MNNKILDRDFMAQYDGGGALTKMAEEATKAGHQFMTIDRYLKGDPKEPALLVSDMATGLRFSTGLIPAVCISFESPIVAYRYYHKINRRTRKFAKIWDWPGAGARIRNRELRFLPNAWPTSAKPRPTLVPWKERRFLVMVNSNKRAFLWQMIRISGTQLIPWIKNLAINLDASFIKWTDSWMSSELYSERLKAISYFSRYNDFDLYGRCWDILRTKEEQKIAKQINRAWRGPIPMGSHHKQEIIANYRFCLCYENTAFPGYLTEKLFDCLFSGVIPIYLGDPDILQRVPGDVFIDARKFESYEEMNEKLRSITPAVASVYLEAAYQFIQSESFKLFTEDSFARSIVHAIQQTQERL